MIQNSMSNNPLQLLTNLKAGNAPSNATGASQLTQQFGDLLNQAIDDLTAQQNTVNDLNDQFVKGQLTDVHQLMIASEKASIGLDLAIQVRNKVIEAYQEIMRTQI